jgi:hypothetical protein
LGRRCCLAQVGFGVGLVVRVAVDLVAVAKDQPSRADVLYQTAVEYAGVLGCDQQLQYMLYVKCPSTPVCVLLHANR